MPLMKLHIVQDAWTPAERDALLDVVHDVMVRCFRVPDRDRYQILNEHPPTHIWAMDTGLGFDRTPRFVLLEVVSRPRTKKDKIEFYRELCGALAEKSGVLPSDLMISFVTNSDEDWSFGMGEAQFLTGAL